MLVIEKDLKIPHDYFKQILNLTSFNEAIPAILSFKHIVAMMSPENIKMYYEDLKRSPNINKTLFIKFDDNAKALSKNAVMNFPELNNTFVISPDILSMMSLTFKQLDVLQRYSILDALKAALGFQKINIRLDGNNLIWEPEDLIKEEKRLIVGGYRTIKINKQFSYEEIWLIERKNNDDFFDPTDKISVFDICKNFNLELFYYQMLMYLKYGKIKK